MKALFLVRHAKSSWDEPTLGDMDRPLNDRGKRDAPNMARRLAKRRVQVDLILCSPARRALATAHIIADRLRYRLSALAVEDRLYPGDVQQLLALVHGLPDKLDRAMLVGHNPAMAELVQRLSGRITPMPTCAIAELRFDAKSWTRVGPATLASLGLERPRHARRERRVRD
jgi:phosphohistidine phosphatase